MAAPIFDNRLTQEWKGFVILRRTIIAIAIVHFSLAAASGYRAIVQVYDVTIDTPPVIGPDQPLTVHVSTSGRTHVDVRVDLIQGNHSENIGTTQIDSNDSFFYDPRAKGIAMIVVVPAGMFAAFTPGEATIRAEAVGRPQWLRTPPPTIDEVKVTLKP